MTRKEMNAQARIIWENYIKTLRNRHMFILHEILHSVNMSL